MIIIDYNERDKKVSFTLTKRNLNLQSLFEIHNTDKQRFGYAPLYEKRFIEMRDKNINILEIGIRSGISLHAWRSYFQNSTVFGIDNLEKHCRHGGFFENNIHAHLADQSDRSQLESAVKKFDVMFDIIIDDGAHFSYCQQISLGFLFKYLKPGGYYIIEDLGYALRIPEQWSKKTNITTIDMLEHYKKTGTIISEFILGNEKAYLEKEIDICDIEEGNPNENNAIMSFITKKCEIIQPKWKELVKDL